MFNNAGLAFCYDRFKCQYSVVEECSGKDEIVTGDALSAWAYYIQRVDTIVRRRISAAEKKQSSVRELSEEDFFNE